MLDHAHSLVGSFRLRWLQIQFELNVHKRAVTSLAWARTFGIGGSASSPHDRTEVIVSVAADQQLCVWDARPGYAVVRSAGTQRHCTAAMQIGSAQCHICTRTGLPPATPGLLGCIGNALRHIVQNCSSTSDR